MVASVLDLEVGKLRSLRKRARRIKATILTGQTPNPRLGAGAGEYSLIDTDDGEPIRVSGVKLSLVELQISQLEP